MTTGGSTERSSASLPGHAAWADSPDARPFRKEVNELDPEKRMRTVNLPVDREVVSLAVGEFNGD